MVSPRATLELEEAREMIAWLHDAMKPPADQFIALRHMSLSRSEKTILWSLWKATNSLSAENIRRRLDVALELHDERGLNSVSVTICRLRKKMHGLGLEISNERGVGFYLDDANKARLGELMRKK